MSLYVLDTDILTLLHIGDPVVVRHVASHVTDEVAAAVISVEEQFSGWYTQLRCAKRRDLLAGAYQRLAANVQFLAGMTILPFPEPAILRYENFEDAALERRKERPSHRGHRPRAQRRPRDAQPPGLPAYPQPRRGELGRLTLNPSPNSIPKGHRMSRVLWLPVLFVFLAPPAPAAEAPQESLKDYIVRSAGSTAYGIYVGDKKAGWEVDEVRLARRDGKDAGLLTTHSYVAVTVDGTKTVQEEKTAIYYALEGEGTVLFAEDRNTEDNQETVRTAVRKGDGLLLTTQVGERKTERSIPMVKNTLALQRRLEAWLQAAKKGDTFDNWTTSWDQDKVDVKEVYTFKEKKTIAWAGVETEAYAVQTVSQGAHSRASCSATPACWSASSA